MSEEIKYRLLCSQLISALFMQCEDIHTETGINKFPGVIIDIFEKHDVSLHLLANDLIDARIKITTNT